jgi:predicted transcriptional regulator
MSDEKLHPVPAEKPLSNVLLDKAGVLNPQDSIQTAGERMRATGQKSLPVADNQKLVGMVNDTSLDQQAARYGHDPSRTTVAESMNKEVIFCFDDENCAIALKRMDECHVNVLTVMDRKMRIVGVLSREDITELSGG